MKKGSVFVLSLVSISVLLWIEQALEVTYIIKTIAKIILFFVIPIVLFSKERMSFLNFRKTDRKTLVVSLIIGITVMSIILFAFFLLHSFIDVDALLTQLNSLGITPAVFPFVALYILFINSILEEFFFRGLLPGSLTHSLPRLLIPSFLFAIYHISIFLTWFTLPILVLAVTGIWIGGIIFQLANRQSKSILPSWIIHMFADLGIVIVGIYLFYIY